MFINFFCGYIFQILVCFYVQTTPSPEKSYPSFRATPSKNRDPVNPAPLLFKNLVRGSTLPPPRVMHTMRKMLKVNSKKHWPNFAKNCVLLYLIEFPDQELFLNKKMICSGEQWKLLLEVDPASIYLLKVYNRNTITKCKICSKLTIKTPERCQWGRSGVFNVNFEHIYHLVLVLTLKM